MTHSFVIVTMNRPAELDRLLRSVFEQTSAPDEIIVVDGGADATSDPMERSLADARIRRIHMDPGLSAQRNRGLSEAVGEIVTFVDDDAVLSPHYCERVLETFAREPDTVAVGGVNGAARIPGRMQRGLRRILLVQTGSGSGRFRKSGFPDPGIVHDFGAEVELLASTALSIRRSACKDLRFEEYWLSGAPFGWATGRCFGEDAWFTAQLAAHGTLRIDPGAVFHHEASARNRESTFVTQALYVFALRWISARKAQSPTARIARMWALLGQGCINTAQSLRFRDSGYLRGYFQAMKVRMK